MKERRQKNRVVTYQAFSGSVEVCVLKSWLAVIKKNEIIGREFSLIEKDDKNDEKR